MYGPVDLQIEFSVLHAFEHVKNACLLHPVQYTKYIKMHLLEIPFIGRDIFEIFCVSLYTNYLSHRHKKLKVASINDINVGYQTWRFYCNLRYADNGQRERPTEKNVIFVSVDHKTCKPIKISISEIRLQNNTYSALEE